MLDQLDSNFRRLSHADLIMRLGNIAERLEGHPAFLPWPDFVPSPTELKMLNAEFTAAVNAAANGDRIKIAERDSLRAKGEQSATLVAQYLVMKSIKDNDLDRLHNLGFDLKKRNSYRSSSSSTLGPPLNFAVKHGSFSGTVVAKSAKLTGAATYEIQCCEGDPTVEANWRGVGLFVHCSRMEITSLEAARKYHFRIRCHGVAGPGLWSSPISLIVI